MKRQNRKHGFTIVELVIVIAVIAILAAVLIPTFVNLINKANESNAQVEAKNLITEMLENILTGDKDTDLLVFSHKGENVYLSIYSSEESRVLQYNGELEKFTEGNFSDHVKNLVKALETQGVIVKNAEITGKDWRTETNTKTIVDNLDAKGDMVVYANYRIVLENFAGNNKAYIGDTAYDSVAEAIENCKEGDTIVLTSGRFVLETTKQTTLKNVTFKAADGAVVNGMNLISTDNSNKLTLEDVTFEGLTFTERVNIGQLKISNGYSQCSKITFKNCNFDLSNSKEKYPDAIYRGSVVVSGDITDEKEANAYINDLIIDGCTFKNVRTAVKIGDARNLTIKNCTVENASGYAFVVSHAAGNIELNNNTIKSAKGVLEIGTVGNNYSTKNVETNVTITNNTAEGMTCKNGLVFYTGYDNARKAGKSTYTITGNTCTYTQTFDEAPLCGFQIKTTYGPSVKEFIPNVND